VTRGCADAMARRFAEHFPATVTHRCIGREAEFHLVGADGRPVDATGVLARLLDRRGGRPAVTADGLVGVRLENSSVLKEVGRATLEIAFDPVPYLDDADLAYRTTVRDLEVLAQEMDAQLVFRGVHPSAVPGPEHMTPKARYRAMAGRLGGAWYWFTVTASDQTHVDVSRAEAAQVFAVLNRLTPVVWALCGNSRDGGGGTQRPTPNSRERRMLELFAAQGRAGRYGMFPEGISTVDAYVSHVAGLELLTLDHADEFRSGSGTWSGWSRREDLTEDEAWRLFSFHEHYVWPSARLRSRTGTLELRAACQQPRDEHLSAATLHLGLVEGWRDLAALRPDRDMGPRALDSGLDLPDHDLAIVEQALEACQEALARRGHGEERFTEPLWRRLELRENPGQREERNA